MVEDQTREVDMAAWVAHAITQRDVKSTQGEQPVPPQADDPPVDTA
jgi:hypothetical protein